MNTSAGVKIVPVDGAAGRKAFIAAGHVPYKDDPAYVAPLDLEVGSRLNPAENPTLKGAAHQLFIAEKDGAPVGRIATLVNKLHLETHKDDTAHFGFLDAVDDPDVFSALLTAAENWARAQGHSRIAGPFSFSVNEELGLLIDGFDTPPYFLMPHGRPWYQTHVEAAGYEKAMDLYALSYKNVKDFIPEKRKRFVDRALANPKVTIRRADFSRFKEEVRLAVDIFNDAWSENWGFVPFTEANAEHMSSELRPIIEKHNFVICEYDGEPAAFALVFPNINEATRDFGGKLFPFNWAKLLYRLKVKRLTQARMPLMGVRKKLQGKPIGLAFAYKMIDIMQIDNMERGLQSSELSWILETNTPMLNVLTEMGGEIYKTYRIYAKAL
ncbi:MAG: GNAT family N-acetyltransferase [Pseudomonadota bacterium]